MRIFKTAILFLLLAQVCLGHEFWLQPRSFSSSEGEGKFPIDIRVGMDFEGKAWGGKLAQVHDLHYFHGDKKSTLAKAGTLKRPVIELKADEPGQYLVGFTNDSTFIELKAEEFHKYVLSEGLETIVEQRKKLGEEEEPGRELYRRCAKTLIQNGSDAGAQAYGKTFELPLELTALKNPYAKDTELQSFQLTFENQPLVNAQVVIWHKDGDKVNRRERRTDERGQVEFPLRQTGKWMVSTVHMVRLEDNPKADWQSYWGSYTFGF